MVLLKKKYTCILSILMHGVITLQDETSYDEYIYKLCFADISSFYSFLIIFRVFLWPSSICCSLWKLNKTSYLYVIKYSSIFEIDLIFMILYY